MFRDHDHTDFDIFTGRVQLFEIFQYMFVGSTGQFAMLDDEPALLFKLRGIDMETFFDTGATADTLADNTEFSTEVLSEMFGIHLDD